MSEKKAAKPVEFDFEKFIKVWQKADDMEEVQKAFPGWEPKQLGSKATYLRSHGVQLKKFKMKPMFSEEDFKRLAKLAEDCAPKE